MSLESHISPSNRLQSLSEKLDQNDIVRIIEAHNGLSALIGERASVDQNGDTIEFDGFWESSLTDTAAKGMPDAEIVGYDSRSDTIDEILNVTTKPMIVDGDTGGSPAQFEYFVKRLERLGVSAVIIEDKTFPKRNSLDASADQSLEDPQKFAQKIQRGQDVKLNDEFMIIARIESLIAGVGLEDALDRARTYIEAGVDGIMIHSKEDDPEDILAFADEYEELCDELGRRPPLVSVPTTYNLKTDTELSEAGFDVVIHANHLLRSAYRAMDDVAETILLNDRSHEADPRCAPVSDIFEEVGFEFIKQQDAKYSAKPSVVIPAAGRDSDFRDTPKSLLDLNGQSLLNYQVQRLRKAGLSDTTVVRGFEANKYDTEGTPVEFTTNNDWEETGNLNSLLQADSAIDDAFISVFSDIIFEPNIVEQLEDTDDDIVLVVDNSYRYHKDDINKDLDLVISKKTRSRQHRSLSRSEMLEIKEIGKDLSKNVADYEFVGIAKFSNRGADILTTVYEDCETNADGSFHEAESFGKAGVTDIIQEIIDRGYTVKALEIHKGWLEVHDREDLEAAREMLAERDGTDELTQ
jgi:phosphoenolpyruvate phosphomutase